MSTQHNDGGPAFPVSASTGDPRDGVYCRDGMSLRDYLAAHESIEQSSFDQYAPSLQFMEAIVGRTCPQYGHIPTQYIELAKFDADFRATLKYIRADAMLRAREKGTQCQD